jgi:hypothetical protein
MRYCDAAVEVLRETGNPCVGYGDHGLCHEISERAGRGHASVRTHWRVLNALTKTPGALIRRDTFFGGVGWTRCFWLPETQAPSS